MMSRTKKNQQEKECLSVNQIKKYRKEQKTEISAQRVRDGQQVKKTKTKKKRVFLSCCTDIGSHCMFDSIFNIS